ADAAGQIDTADGLAPIQLPTTTLVGAQATTNVDFGGNLPSDVAVGTNLVRDVEVFDALGASSTLTLAFTRTAAGWNVSGSDGGAPVTGALTFNPDGTLASGDTLNVNGRTVDMSGVTGYAALSTVEVETVNGNQAGSLQSFSINADGTIIGAFSNGTKQDIG